MDVDVFVIGVVGFDDFGVVVDDVGGGEVWIGDVLYQFIDGQVGVVYQCQVVVDYFVEVVWWDVGCYIYGDIVGIVDQQVGNFGWYDCWDLFGVIVVGYLVDGFFFQVCQQFMGQFGYVYFGVLYGCGVVVVY